MEPAQLDKSVVNLARAVRNVESGDNFNARGKSGEYGGYQYTPATWAAHSKAAGINAPLESATKEDQNKVFYTWAKAQKDAGKNVGEIVSMHNAGEGRPQAYLEGNKGTNKFGVDYDTAEYARKVAQKYQELKSMDGGEEPAPTEPVEEPRKKTFLEKASGLFNAFFPTKNIGEAIGTSIAKARATPEERQYIEPSKATLGGIAGDVAQNALYFTPMGRAAGLATKGIEAVAPRFAGGALAKTAGNVAAGAGTGYAFDVANNFSNDKENKFTPGLGTALGGALPLVAPALKGAGYLASEALGASTGTGGKVIRTAAEQAAKGGAETQAFKEALRGQTSPESIVTDARKAFGNLKETRREAYTQGLKKLQDETMITKKGKTYVKKFDQELGKEILVPTNLSTKGVKDVATRTLKSIGLDAKGRGIDFSSRPSLDGKGIQKIHDFVYDWKDLTPEGLNTLRQEVAGFRKGGINPSPADSRFNLYVDRLSGNLKNYLGERVPQIQKMNDQYAAASKVIKDVKAGLSLGDRVQTDTAFRKLNSVLRTNNEFRQQLLGELKGEAARTLPAKIAGQQLSEFLPRGLVRPVGALAAGAGALTGVGIIPMLQAAVLTSPRIVGEMLLAIGFTRRQASKFMELIGAKSSIFPGDVAMDYLNNRKAGKAMSVAEAVPSKEFKDFPRNKGLSGEDSVVQEATIRKFLDEKETLVKDYLKENGNIVNTDDARKLFEDVGYNGTNSAATHEASSAVSNAAFDELLSKAKPGQDAYFMAGSSGSGKTTTVRNKFGDELNKAAFVLDGNLSNYESALKKIVKAENKGVRPTIAYVYRDPSEAWNNGVIKRMLGNGRDAGRVVPLKEFLKNVTGSLNTVKKVINDGVPTVGFNNGQAGNVTELTIDDIKKLQIPADTQMKLVKDTVKLARDRAITKEQYEALLDGIPHPAY